MPTSISSSNDPTRRHLPKMKTVYTSKRWLGYSVSLTRNNGIVERNIWGLFFKQALSKAITGEDLSMLIFRGVMTNGKPNALVDVLLKHGTWEDIQKGEDNHTVLIEAWKALQAPLAARRVPRKRTSEEL